MARASGDGTVGKALQVLEEVAAFGRPVRFSEVLAASEFPKPTLYRLIQTLSSQGMLDHDTESNLYSPGTRLVRLAHAAWRQSSLAQVARPHLEALSELTGETVHLAKLDSAQVLYLDKCNSAQPIEMYSDAGKVGPAYCTGVGKAMLAFLPEDEAASLIGQQSFHKFTEHTLISEAELREELIEIRTHGYGFDREEHEPSIICVCVTMNQVIKRYGVTQVIHGIDLEIADGEFCVFVGPSGCGKSTLLRMVAGLEETTEGAMHIGSRDVTKLDPSDRGVAMVFQTYALYPHMTVKDNMGFGLKMNGHPKNVIQEKVAEASRILKLDEYLDRKPAALSGGQRQRVSIGRAIVRGPEVFLFDEPLSNLDAELRVEMRVEIARLHKEIGATMIYVTHDQVEAMTLADKIVVLRLGVIEQVGAPMDLYRDPDNKFVAGFIGSPAMNFMAGTVGDGEVEVPSLKMSIPATVATAYKGHAVHAGLRPEHLEIDRNGDALRVDLTESLGGVSYAYLVSDTGERIVVEERGDERVSEGERVGLNFDASRLYLFDAKTEARIRS